MKRHLMMMCFALSWLLCSQTAAQSTDSDYELSEAAQLPANLVIADRSNRALVAKVWRRSATFRTQCARIAQADGLTVRLSFNPKMSSLSGCNCYALTTTDPKHQRIVVRIFDAERAIEMLGHEFEHVVEQIEGIQLRTLAATKGARVYENPNGNFETRRAMQAGRRVKEEYFRARRNGTLVAVAK